MKSETYSPETEINSVEASFQFFALSENLGIVRNARSKLEEQFEFVKDKLSDKEKFVLEGTLTFLRALEAAPKVFDENCALNRDAIGSSLMSRLGTVTTIDAAGREEIFVMSYRFLIELQLSTTFDLSMELSQIVHRVRDFDWSGNPALQVQYAEHQMLIGVVRKFIHHPKMSALQELPKVIAKSERERTALEEQISSREERIEALKQNLQKYESAFNFVALYDGFKALRDQKRRESLVGLLWMIVLGLMMITPFVGKIYLTFNPVAGVQADFYTYASLVGLELVLLFLFRVALHGYRAVKAQLIQIDLRMALCQFIQGYAEYASEVRKKDSQLLDRFDQLIFSGIVTTEAAIPSTFDGFEQLTSLVAKIKDAR